MQPINFAGANHLMGPPKDRSSPVPCDPLVVRIEGNTVTSVWKPTTQEIEMLRAGAMICLHVYGGQPPVQILAEFVEELPAVTEQVEE